MLKVTRRGILAHKFRLVSTFLAVILGVSFMAGSFVLTDTIGAIFDDLFTDVNAGTDAVVRKLETFEPGQGAGTGRGRVEADVLETVRGVEGVAAAEGLVGPGYAQFKDHEGEAIGDPINGAPTFGFNWSDAEELNPYSLTEGRPPEASDEVVMDKATADDNDFSLGDDVEVITINDRPRSMTIVGIVRFGDADSPAGATVAIFDTATAQELVGQPGKFEAIGVVGADGVTPEALVRRLEPVLDDDLEVITGEANAAEQQEQTQEFIDIFNIFLLVFALVSLFVGSFIIYNTFSIIVAQRTRELALLRAIGAGPGQVLGSVLLEALVIGLVASVLGVLVGIGLATVLQTAIAAIGIDLPTGPTVVRPQGVIIAVITGTIITLIASLFPSVKAARVPPVAAMRAVAVEEGGRLVLRRVVGGLMLLAGVGLIVLGLFTKGGNAGVRVGSGAVLVFLAVAVLTPLIARPLSRLIGAPLPRARGISGTLARENAMRNPRRTSTTAGALMIGIGLVGFITIFGDSAKASVEDTVAESFVGDFAVASGSFGFSGLPPELAEDLNEVPEVANAAGLRFTSAQINFGREEIQGVDPEQMFDIVDIGITEGSAEGLDEDGIALHVDQAAENHLGIGDIVAVNFPDTGLHEFQVAMIFSENDALDVTNNTDYILGLPAYEASVEDQADATVFVTLADGISEEQGRRAIERVTDEYPVAEVQNQAELKEAQASNINQFLQFVYLLLGLAIVIAGVGIMNTLALSVYERTRELGLLRAVGAHRSQLRSAIRWEAVIIALLGTFLGLVIGVFFGWILVQALKDEGFTVFRIPFLQLGVITGLAGLLGVLAAIPPTIRASRLNVLEAIEAE